MQQAHAEEAMRQLATEAAAGLEGSRARQKATCTESKKKREEEKAKKG